MRGALGSEDEACRFAAAWSAALLGDAAALRVLGAIAERYGGPFAERACAMAIRKMDPERGVQLAARDCRDDAGGARGARGAAALGDPALMPWIIECMGTPELARAAGRGVRDDHGGGSRGGEAAGARPPGFSGPSDDPGDEDVAMDRTRACLGRSGRTSAVVGEQGEGDEAGDAVPDGKRLDGRGVDRRGAAGRSQPARAAAAVELAMRRAWLEVVEVEGARGGAGEGGGSQEADIARPVKLGDSEHRQTDAAASERNAVQRQRSGSSPIPTA